MGSKIRLKQIEELELSGFIADIFEAIQTKDPAFVVREEDLMPTGQNAYQFSFDYEFESIPKVIGTVKGEENILGFQIEEVTLTGFRLALSDTVSSEGYSFSYIATEKDGIVEI